MSVNSQRARGLRGAGIVWCVLLVGAACGQRGTDPSAIACTEIGCSDGLAVELERVGAATIELVEDGVTRHSFECSAGAACRTFVPGYTPARVEIVMRQGDTSRRHTVQPGYTINRPNGPDCPPVCRQATVTVDVEDA